MPEHPHKAVVEQLAGAARQFMPKSIPPRGRRRGIRRRSSASAGSNRSAAPSARSPTTRVPSPMGRAAPR